MPRFVSNNKGFSLLEMMLTVIIFSGVLLAVFNTLQNYAEDRLARSTSDFITQIQVALDELLADPNQFTTIYTAVGAAPNGIIDVPLNDLVNGTGIIPAPVNNLNANYQNFTPWKTGYNIMLRAADDLADPTDIPALEVIIATNDRVEDTRVRKAATYAKGHGGFFRGADARIANNVESSFATWNFPVANLNGTAWAAAVAADALPPSFDNGTYFFHYTHYNFNDVSGDYLYRQNIAGQPQLNRMHADLNLGQNSILGADDLDPILLNVTAKAVINGSADVNGNTTLVRGNFDTNNTMTADFARINGVGTGSTGNFINEGTIQSEDANFSNRLSANAATFNGGLNTTADIVANNLDISGRTNAGDSFANSLITDSGPNPTLNTRQLNTSNIETNQFIHNGSNRLGTIDMIVNRDINVRGNLTVERDLTINELQPSSFGHCDNGC